MFAVFMVSSHPLKLNTLNTERAFGQGQNIWPSVKQIDPQKLHPVKSRARNVVAYSSSTNT